MNLRFSSRGVDPDALVHLSVTDTLRFGEILRRRGEALCRPRGSLPNLEPLPLQTLGARRCCEECVALLARLRLRRQISLPPAGGVAAAELVRRLRQADAKRPVRQRSALSIATSADWEPRQ